MDKVVGVSEDRRMNGTLLIPFVHLHNNPAAVFIGKSMKFLLMSVNVYVIMI